MPKIAKWRQLEEAEFAKLVAESFSFQELARKIGYEKISGGVQTTLKEVVKERNLDTSHFLGQGWRKNNFDYSRFQEGKALRTKDYKDALIYLRGNQCECCKATLWLEQSIPLEIHHLDGNHLNNELENLQLLCPNCHALTNNWRGKNINKGTKVVSDEEFIQALKNNSSVRKALLSLGLNGSGGNYERAYRLINDNVIEHLMKNK